MAFNDSQGIKVSLGLSIAEFAKKTPIDLELFPGWLSKRLMGIAAGLGRIFLR